jgi:hypothetical protein
MECLPRNSRLPGLAVLSVALLLAGPGCEGGRIAAGPEDDVDVRFALVDVVDTRTSLLPDNMEGPGDDTESPPETTTPPDIPGEAVPVLSCGDGTCDGGEDCLTCPDDCGECPPFCGNGTCDEGEDCSTCPGDCGECPPGCGDGQCIGNESCSSCPDDCGVCPPECGDGQCNGEETCSTCPGDCGQCPPGCGDGQCIGNESCSSCPDDCGVCPPECGDGQCNGEETCSTCPGDCGQCPPGCGDGQCDGNESCSSCPDDCGVCPPECGDGQCNGEENCLSCQGDCGACTGTGDCCQVQMTPGCGTLAILQCVCAQDDFCCLTKWDVVCVDEVEELGCGSCTPEPVCGDGQCNGVETCSTCPGDCGICPPPLDPPGGRTNFVVALGKLHSGENNNDWVRLGTYLFNSGTHEVTAAMWKWTQSSPTHREGSGIQPNGTCSGGADEVRKCEILMPAGFKDAANDNRTGTYGIKTDSGTGDPYVRIDWNPDWYEEWWLPTEGAETYAVLRLKKSDKATVAFAYGSNAPFSERRALSTIVQKTGQRYEKWVRKQACSDCTYAQVSNQKSTTSQFSQGWTICGNGLTWVMTLFDPESSGDCSGSNDTSIQYYFFRASAADRRDGWWFWHTCKTEGGAWNECYGCDNNNRHGGSHTFAMMQVLNDSNQYVGHIGVEVGFDEGSCSNATEYRYSDVLGVARITPETEWLNDPNQVP